MFSNVKHFFLNKLSNNAIVQTMKCIYMFTIGGLLSEGFVSQCIDKSPSKAWERCIVCVKGRLYSKHAFERDMFYL